MRNKVFVLLGVIYFLLSVSCSKEQESFEDSVAKTQVTFKINSIEEINSGTVVVKSTITVFAVQQELTHYGLYYKEDQNFNYDADILHEDTHKPDGKEVTIEFADTVKNLPPQTDYFFKLVAWIQPQPEGKDCRQFSSVVKYSTKKTALQVIELSSTSGTYHDEILIKGRGFSKTLSDNKVTFNGLNAVITEAYSDSLRVLVPKKAGSGDVKIIVGNEQAEAGKFEYVYEPYVVYTFAGGALDGFLDGKGAAAKFNEPHGLVMDKNGNLFVADAGNNRIRKITSDGTVISFAGTGKFACLNGSGSTSQFESPDNLAITQNPYGNILVPEFRDVRLITADASQVTTFVGSFDNVGYADGTGSEAKFNWISGIIGDKSDNFYVSDYWNNCVRKIDPNGKVTTFAQVNTPRSITIDSDGNLFVVSGNDANNIYKITPFGDVILYIGPESGISNIIGLTFDSQDNLFLTTNYCIKKVNKEKQVSVFAGKENIWNQFANGGISKALFGFVKGITTDNLGNFYVTDNNCIRKIEKVE